MTEPPPGLAALADALDARRGEILQAWRDRVRDDASLRNTSDWTRKQFYDHFPDVLEAFGRKLRHHPAPVAIAETDACRHAHAHAKTRWLQGYALRDLIREWGHFGTSVVAVMGALRESGGVAAGADFAIAEQLWSDLTHGQLTESAQEYQQLQQAEAATRAEELAAMLERLRSLGEVRARSLNRAATGLRGELSTLLTSSALLGEGASDAERAELQALSRDSMAALDRALADMILLTRLEAGLETREIAPFDASHELSSLVASLQPHVGQSNTQLTSCGPERLPVEGDERAVREIARHLVLTGLLSDVPAPVDLEWGDDSRQGDRWLLTVRQHLPLRSPPSSPPISRAIADASDRAQQAQGRAPTGFEAALRDGLIPVASGDGSNVLIAKHLCELIDASIELESDEGVVTFRVSVPRAYAS